MTKMTETERLFFEQLAREYLADMGVSARLACMKAKKLVQAGERQNAALELERAERILNAQAAAVQACRLAIKFPKFSEIIAIAALQPRG